MINYLSNIVNIFKGKEQADWVVKTWLRDHADEYQDFVAGIEKMAEGDMTTAFEMFRIMKECMTPEAEQYYDVLLRTLSGDANAYKETSKLEHAIEIGECAVNDKIIEINIGTGEVRLTETPRKGMLVVKASNLLERWDKLPLYSKAYCKEQYEIFRASLPKELRANALDMVLNLLKIHYVANLVFMPGIMAYLYDKAVIQKEDMLYAMYYFVTYDHGLQRMAHIFSRVVNNEVPDVDGVTVFKSTMHSLTMTSLTNGWDTKEMWTETAEHSDNDEAWKEIMHAVHYAKAKHGKPTEQKSIDELLKCRDKDKAKSLMLEFLKEHNGLYGLAYLRWCLDRTVCIKDVSYMVYHRAMEVMLGKQIGFKKPQERYGLLNNQNHEQHNHVRIWKEVDRIMRKWQSRFNSLR